MKHQILIPLAVIGLLFTALIQSCKGDGAGKSKDGYEFTLHTKSTGAKIVEGDKVNYDVFIRKGDSLIFTSTSRPGGIEAVLDSNAFKLRVMKPFLNMAEGDSLTAYFPMDSITKTELRGIAEKFTDKDKVRIDYKVSKVTSKVELEKLAAAAKAQSAEVNTTLEADIDAYKAGTAKVQKTETGLMYIVHKEGTGKACTLGSNAEVHYLGKTTADKKTFDGSFERGQTFMVANAGAANVIPGWNEGLQLMKEGAAYTFIIPSALGYGENGAGAAIPGNAELAFYIEMISVK